MVDTSFGCGTGRALTFPGEIFEHIFTSLVRVSLPDADSGGRRTICGHVWKPHNVPDGKGHPTCTIRRNTGSDNILLVQMAQSPLPPPPPSPVSAYLRSIFSASVSLSSMPSSYFFPPRKIRRKIGSSDEPICHSSTARPCNQI